MPLATYRVHGLDCAEEVRALKRVLRPLVAADESLRFDLMNGTLTIDAGDLPGPEAVRSAIAQTGMRAVPLEQHERELAARDTQPLWQRHGRLLLCAASGLCALSAYAYHAAVAGPVGALTAGESGAGYPYPAVALYLASALLGLVLVANKAWGAVRIRRADINLLVVIATAGAMLLGNWLEAATVAFLFAVAQWLEHWSVARAHRSVTALLELSPASARVRCGCSGDWELKPATAVTLGARVQVRPGERIPLDGVVVSGTTSINQAPVTGESIPVSKGAGDAIFAGTINLDGVLELDTTSTADDSTIARIVRMVREAQSRRAPTEQWIDRFAAWYTPAMIVVAALVFVCAPLATTMTWAESFYFALVLLLIACPCALVISTPVSIVAALATAARHGVLVKGGAYLEGFGKLNAIAFDKTGTLTRGLPAVQHIYPLDGLPPQELLALAAAVEGQSTHPLAAAIRQRAQEEGVMVPAVQDHRTLAGRGAEAQLGGALLWVGSQRLLAERANNFAEAGAQAARMEDAGHTVVIVGRDQQALGLIGIADAVRAEARDVIETLRKSGVATSVMLTGDNEVTAARLAETLGLSRFAAGLLPADKVAAVEQLVREHGSVAMVGDGINDAPALAAATVGVAMGAAGSDAALEAADIALMGDDLTRIPWLVGHSRRTLRIIAQNVTLAIGLKLLVLVPALAGFGALWLAIVADMGASLLVTANALRLLRDR